jgi:hypothetical protein
MMLAANQLSAQQSASFEDAVMMASDGMIIRGTVMTVQVEGKDALMPKAEAGTPLKLRTIWNIRVDECYYSSDKECADRIDSIVTLSAFTGMAVEREGALVYGEIITNATGIAVTTILAEGQSYLLFVRPDASKPDAYQILPVHNGCSRINDNVVDIELRRHDLLSPAAKSLPANMALVAKSVPIAKGPKTESISETQVHYFADVVPMKDIGALINHVRSGTPNNTLNTEPQQ